MVTLLDDKRFCCDMHVSERFSLFGCVKTMIMYLLPVLILFYQIFYENLNNITCTNLAVTRNVSPVVTLLVDKNFYFYMCISKIFL